MNRKPVWAENACLDFEDPKTKREIKGARELIAFEQKFVDQKFLPKRFVPYE